MNKEQQDRRWNELSDDAKEINRREYAYFKQSSTDLGIEIAKDFETFFGSHNLQPKPKIRTWEDVAIYNPELWDFINKLGKEIANCPYIGSKLYKKMIATIHIQKLIELGYGGMVTEEEWKLSTSYIKETVLWTIVCEYRTESKELQFRIAANWGVPDLLSFHTQQQATEFLLYPENVELVKQYNLL